MGDISELPEERTPSRVGVGVCRTLAGNDMTDRDVCPYPGLASFRSAEARWFFGRKPDIDAMIGYVGARLDGGVPLAVVAPSGAGKSSLLAAGLVPALADGALAGSQDWPVTVTTPSTHPLTALAGRIADLIGADPAAAAAATADPVRFEEFLISYSERQRETGSAAQAVLIVDQFEEVFAECQEPERQAFITVLCTVARTAPVIVIIGVRADFYGSCLKYPALVPALRNQMLLEPIRADQLRSIITGPAEAEDFEVEPGLVELLLRDLGVVDAPGAVAGSYDPGALPLLAHTLQATWQRRSGRLLTVTGYRRTGGLREAIATTAEDAYTRLDPPEQRIVQQLLLRLVNVGEQTGALRRRVSRERLLQALRAPAEETEKILEVFGRARLLTFGTTGFDATSVEITHEALLWAWPRLDGWINSDRAGLRIHQMLSDAADVWKAEARDPTLLCRDRSLAIAQDWAAGPGRKDKLNELEATYLQASIDQAQHEQEAEQRRTRRLRALTGVLAVALVIAILAGIFAVQLYLYKARQGLRTAATEQAGNSISVINENPEVGMLLAVSAHRLAKDEPITRSALLSAQSRYFTGLLTGYDGPINTVKFSPVGRMLATTSDDGIVRLWSADKHDLIAPLIDHGSDSVYDAEFSPDGLMLATASRDGIVRIWNLSERKIDVTLPLSDASGATAPTVTSMKFSHDSRILATTSDRGEAQLWGAQDGHPIYKFQDSIKRIAFSKHGSVLATVDLDQFVSLWKLDESERPVHLGTTDESSQPVNLRSDILSLTFSPDGNMLATGSYNWEVRLWDVRNPKRPILLEPSLTGPAGGIDSMVFNPNGKTLLASSSDDTVWLWDIAAGQKIGKKINTLTIDTLTNNKNFVKSVALADDANTIATVGDDRVVRLWDMQGPIVARNGRDIQFSPDGRFLAVAEKDSVQLWDMINRSQIGTLPASVQSMTFSENGAILATVENSDTAENITIVRLWDATNNQLLAQVPSRPPQSTNIIGKRVGYKVVAFGPREGILAIADNNTTGGGNIVQLWDLTDLAHLEILGEINLPDEVSTRVMTFSRDGRILVTAGANGGKNSNSNSFAQLWNVANPRQSKPFGEGTGNSLAFPEFSDVYVSHAVFTSDDHTLITVEPLGIVRRWPVDTGRLQPPQEPFTPPARKARAAEFSSDGKTLAIINDGETAIRLWYMDNAQRTPAATLTGHNDNIKIMRLSRNGRLLATASTDGIVRIWDLHPDSVATHLCRTIGIIDEEKRKRWEKTVSVGLPDNSVCDLSKR